MSHFVTLEAPNGARVDVVAGSYNHMHLREQDEGGAWRDISAERRSSMMRVGVAFDKEGNIVRDEGRSTMPEDYDPMRPKAEQGQKLSKKKTAAKGAAAEASADAHTDAVSA